MTTVPFEGTRAIPEIRMFFFSRIKVAMFRILLSDHDEMNSMIIEMILRKAGYEVLSVLPEFCIGELKSSRFDLLLLGISSLHGGGMPIVEWIRADASLQDIKIILLASAAMRIDLTNAYRLGVLDFIRKPALPEVVTQKVRDALQKTHKDTILVVDDDPGNLIAFTEILSICYSIRTAASGREAMDLIRQEVPDLLLLDLHMPGMDGFEVMETLSEIDSARNLPVIVVTADDDADTAAQIFQYGAMDYLTKPVVMQVAIQRIRRILALSHFQNDLRDEIRQKNRDLLAANMRLQALSDQTIYALAGAIDAKDAYTNGHSRRVAQYSREIARRMGKGQYEQNEIYNVALLHDIGKIAIPNGIIDKPGKLTDEEYRIIKSHTVRGYEILKNITVMPLLYIGARWHHERYDGRGYPDGKKGQDIPEIARIISVADCYDAMSSDRSYREALPQRKVRSEIEEGLGTQFDPEIGRIMIAMIDDDRDYRMCHSVCFPHQES